MQIAETTKAGRYSLENANAGTQPYTPAPLQADCHEIHETAATLLATLGQPRFEPLRNAPTAKGETGMSASYIPYHPEQQQLLPSALQDWLPEGHLAYFINDTVGGA